MSENVKADSITGALRNTAALLTEDILASALSNEDPRYGPAGDLVVRAVWSGYWNRERLNPEFAATELSANEFTDFISEMEGRVLTVIEGIFPAGQQCEALKSLARQEVWQMRSRVVCV